MAFWNKKKPADEPVPTVDPVVDPETETLDPELQEEPPAERKPEPKRRRSEVLKLRLTPEELAYLTDRAKAAGMNRTDFILASVEGAPMIVIDEAPQLLLELRRQGNNLNQLVHLAHEKQSPNLPQLQAAVQCCVEAQAEIVRMCTDWGAMIRTEIALDRDRQKGGGG